MEHNEAATLHDEAAAWQRVAIASLATTSDTLYEYVANGAETESANASEASEAIGAGDSENAALALEWSTKAWALASEGDHEPAAEAHDKAAHFHRLAAE